MKTAICALLLFVGCSSDPELGSGNGQCSQRSGSFITKYTVRSGNCGDTAEAVVNVTSQPTGFDPPCTGSISYSSDNCEVTYSSTCPNDGAVKGGKLTITGKSKWNVGGTQAAATESWSLANPDGTTLCQGTYDVTITKQ